MASSSPASGATVAEFGKLPSGELVHKIHLDNGAMTADVLTYGANLVSVKVPSSASPEPREVTLNGTDLASVLELGSSTYMGAVAGRFANRIAGGTFSLDGETHVLARNNGTNHLHGGKVGFDKRVWDIVGEPTSGSVSLRLVSADGDEGYPGELTTVVTYSLSRTNELGIAFQATVAGRPTVLNLCNHAYWNLSGADDGGDGVADHTLWLGCRHFVETDEDLVPTGRVVPAEGAMDFSAAGGVALGPRLDEVSGGSEPGFDHCFCRGGVPDEESAAATGATMGAGQEATVAILAHPGTGRTMTVRTTQPGVQLYTANFLPKERGVRVRQHGALCLETQHLPDSPNHPGFPPVVLRPGERFSHETTHTFAW
ncbi:hypothetical protein FNF31_05873 [Cafeteria roenbergensis]|uniref:Aldose 1-epimerase n=1 Tax=Cafeteria roenbergensis TaxID=33653 RepID=A0A5A8CWD2_CAFRO|nr:hypothetical protein FNF31_05873 [Cafeteria roenbergensis]